MKELRPAMKMPELLVFARAFGVGIACAEVFRIGFYVGESFSPSLSQLDWLAQAAMALVCLAIVLIYAWNRDAYAAAARLGRSYRLDLLLTVLVGVWSNLLVAPWLSAAHKVVKQSSPQWAPAIVAMLFVLLLSPVVRRYWPPKKRELPQLYFLGDEEITKNDQDVFASEDQAKSFADAVIASGAHSGLVFGVDGPWGVGKTSFINLAELHWANEASIIVFRFEPLRYASEADLSQRFIRELSAAIQRQVYAPEFKPVASRYSRMLKGKADVSFFGFKLSLEPTDETIDEMLEDVDDVLNRIGRRIIIVIDDLDRLEAEAVNNVLFTVRRTFKLSQATYILCYDTENLVGEKADKENAREFLEKFVTVKLSLFVDSSTIKNFLERDWSSEEKALLTVPSDSMLKLAAVLGELAEMLGGDMAARYMSLLGDLRKVKRFVNAVLLMQIERTDLGRTDFDRRDLINLMLLHLNYPGLFRQIYLEETDGRSGTFSVRRNPEQPKFSNTGEFADVLEKQGIIAQFLLGQLFDVQRLRLDAIGTVDEAVLSSRACFNQGQHRNLEKYLKLIVRFVTPEPRETFVLYQTAVERVRGGAAIKLVLEETEFRLVNGEHAHDQFWRVFVNQSDDLTRLVAEDAINALVDYLPRYSSVGISDRALRSRSIYSLLRLLDKAGWGRTSGRRLPNSSENIVEIAYRIFGERDFAGQGIIRRLASADRGVLGWNDLMLFRLQCSADRQGQLFNLQSALILCEDSNASATGLSSTRALNGMRRLSQEVFTLFRAVFIEPRRNFLTEVDETSDAAFFGDQKADTPLAKQVPVADPLGAERSAVKSFVLYQLSNRQGPNGQGVGCGFYDEVGREDQGSIGKLMNDYIFEVCFNPNVQKENIYHFADRCLSHLDSAFFSGYVEDGYVPTRASLLSGLDPVAMSKYWLEHREAILNLELPNSDRRVVTSNYVATYQEDLPKIFALLDELSKESTTYAEGEIDEN